MFATAGSHGVARSQSLQFFHGSEAAFWPNDHDHLASVLMSLSGGAGSEIILESTAAGAKGMFFELCLDAMAGKNDFRFIFLPWFWHHNYQTHNPNNNYELSTPWKEYQTQYNLSKAQLSWAYLKNQVLCKISGEKAENGPSQAFMREFPASYQEAFLVKENGAFISSVDLMNAAIDITALNAPSHTYGEVKQKINIFRQKQYLSRHEPLILGVDVARGGGDYSWIIDRKGELLGFGLNQKINLNDTMQVAYWVAGHINKLNPAAVFIDAGGGGIAVADRLAELGFKSLARPVNFAAKANAPHKYLNKRAEIWSLLKDFITEGGLIIHCPELLKQIAAVKYGYTQKGQLQLEAKRYIKSSLGSSPDGADAAALTFAESFTHKPKIACKSNIISHSYNPFAW